MENLKMLETFRKLEETLGKGATHELISLFDQKIEDMEKELATKSDLYKLETALYKVESTLIKWFLGSGLTVIIIYAVLSRLI